MNKTGSGWKPSQRSEKQKEYWWPSVSDETIIDYNRLIVARGVTTATIDSNAEKSILLYLLPVYLPIPIIGYFPIELEVIAFVLHLQLFNIQSCHTNLKNQ